MPGLLLLKPLASCKMCSTMTRPQVGLNGVDNGAIRFTHVRIPRVNLLDRFGCVDKSGRCARVHASLLRFEWGSAL